MMKTPDHSLTLLSNNKPYPYSITRELWCSDRQETSTSGGAPWES